MHDALLKDYELSKLIKENLWTFCELSLSIYKAKEYAEMLHIGGAHMTSNPCKAVIQSTDELSRINNKVLPQLMQTLWNLIGGNQ
jgi:hypothetical protein